MFNCLFSIFPTTPTMLEELVVLGLAQVALLINCFCKPCCSREGCSQFPTGGLSPLNKRGLRVFHKGCALREVDHWGASVAISLICVEACGTQETVSDDSDCHGRVPRTVDIELFEDLVDTCSIGDTVRIVGLVKVINADQHKGVSSKCSDVSDLVSPSLSTRSN